LDRSLPLGFVVTLCKKKIDTDFQVLVTECKLTADISTYARCWYCTCIRCVYHKN